MRDTFRSDIIGKDQLVHLVDRIWLKEQTGYVLRMRPESKSYQRTIEHYHGFDSNLTDVEINKARHPIKRIVKIIIHFYVKIIAISMQTVIENLYSLSERKFAEKKRFDDQEPFEYLDVDGFEDYHVLMMNWKIETPFILKTICEVMLNKPSSKPIKDILINLYKRQPETEPATSLELSELWMKFVEHVLESYDEIVLENEPKAHQKRKTSRQSPSVFDESFSNLVWTNILSSLEEIETFTLKFAIRCGLVLLNLTKKNCRRSVPLPALMP
ncbi:uncharacterized protein LOC107360275 [Tetranychus urticae]|uniref:Uncharacterized protein n=1 Tax=Tetranychus urticae TaxID=32264 RepID=T1K608_TETUR|nr:uncharacterized protein LOC107360275 [Tetranychus urticae]